MNASDHERGDAVRNEPNSANSLKRIGSRDGTDIAAPGAFRKSR